MADRAPHGPLHLRAGLGAVIGGAVVGWRNPVPIVRDEGLRSLVIKVLAATCYSRLVVLGRTLDDSIPRVESEIELEYALLGPGDIDDYVALVPGSSREELRTRLAEGQHGFTARHDGRLVGVSWALTGRVRVPYLRASLDLEADEAMVAEAYVTPELRGLGISSSTGYFRLKWLRAAGYTLALTLVLAENRAGFMPPARLEYERLGTAYGIGVGPLRRAMVVRRAGK